MDIDVLITEVYLKPPIWDKRLKDYSNRNKVGECWREISKEMGVQEGALRKKWKYLRDQFSVEAGKLKNTRSGGAESSSHQPKWPYYEPLLFLKDVIKPRPSLSKSKRIKAEKPSDEEQSVIVSDDDSQQESNSIKNVQNISEQLEIYLNNTAPNTRFPENDIASAGQITAQRKCLASTSNNNEISLEHEKQKIEVIQHVVQTEPDNDDMMFFKSLMPFVDKIPQNLKLRFRNRIQAVVEEFAFG